MCIPAPEFLPPAPKPVDIPFRYIRRNVGSGQVTVTEGNHLIGVEGSGALVCYYAKGSEYVASDAEMLIL